MKYGPRLCLSLVILLAGPSIGNAQAPFLPPDGGGIPSFPAVPCLSPGQATAIQARLDSQIATLPKAALSGLQKKAAVSLAWPLQQAAGFHYFGVYAISNFVDHDLSYPGHVLDWNCGNRTYDDASGYNHAGTDIFLWPFPNNMMAAGQAEIVAAAPGIIIGKDDGNPDQSCAMNGGQWNAVYVMHSDSTVAWYGHMKKNSLTSKNVGASVAQGEFLGLAGSSGNSTGPHLHFELHDKHGNVLDPFQGSCSATGFWQNQQPYYNPGINALLTHSRPPQDMPCPQPDLIYAKDTFALNDTIVFAAYYRDPRAGAATTYTVSRPDGSTFSTWNYAPGTSYTAGYWYWTRYIPADAPRGVWQFKASFQGKNYQHPFFVNGIPNGITATSNFSGSYYPNPAREALWLQLRGEAMLTLRNCTGQVELRQAYAKGKPITTAQLPAGVHFLEVDYADGHREMLRIEILH